MKLNFKKTVFAASITALFSASALAAEPVRMIVEAKANKISTIKNKLKSMGIEINRELASLDSLAVTLDKSQLKNVSIMDGIDAFYPDVKRSLMTEGQAELLPYGLSMVQGDKVRYMGGKQVCIIDSGYSLGHPDLPVNGVTGAEDGGAGPWYEDQLSHGTHVTGTIAALQNGAGSVGIVSDESLELHIVRVFNGRGDFAYASDLAGAIEDCREAGSSIVSMSLGGPFSSHLEQRAIDRISRENVLLIAAAGNSGAAQHSYPASYDSVVSVAAIDDHKSHAGFSQRSAQVELAAPGVNVFSTLPEGRGSRNAPTMTVEQDNFIFQSTGFQSYTNTLPSGKVSGELADCGIGAVSCGDMTGKICLLERGGWREPEGEGQLPSPITFQEKVDQCAQDGGVGAIVRNHMPGQLQGTVDNISIIAGTVSQKQGLTLLENVGKETTISVAMYPDHGFKSGTSMATPHVSGVAAVVWSHYPECSATGIRLALQSSAEDLGEPGYDSKFGWGLVQAQTAIDYISANGCHASNGKIYGGDGSAR